MKTRIAHIILVAALLLAGISTSVPLTVKAKSYYTYNFETTVTPWVVAADTCALLDYGLKRSEHSGSCSDTDSLIKNGHAELWAHASAEHMQSLVWMSTGYAAEGQVSVNLDWSASTLSGCGGCSLVAYIGTEAPRSIGQFSDKMGTPGAHWETFKHHAYLDAEGQVYVALGVRGAGALMAIDCVTVQIMPFED